MKTRIMWTVILSLYAENIICSSKILAAFDTFVFFSKFFFFSLMFNPCLMTSL